MTQEGRKKGKWQNLAKGMCPFCDDSKMRGDGPKVFVCDKCQYYIPRWMVIDYLTNPESKARQHMDKADVARINATMQS